VILFQRTRAAIERDEGQGEKAAGAIKWDGKGETRWYMLVTLVFDHDIQALDFNCP